MIVIYYKAAQNPIHPYIKEMIRKVVQLQPWGEASCSWDPVSLYIAATKPYG